MVRRLRLSARAIRSRACCPVAQEDGIGAESAYDARDRAGALGGDGQPHRRLREVSIVALDEIGRSPECRDHAAEALGRRPRGERPIHPGDSLGVVAGQAPQDEHLGRESARHRVQPGVTAPPRQEIDALPYLERIAHVMAERLAHVGQERDDPEPRFPGDREQALGERGRGCERRQQGAGADLDVHDEGVEPGGELLREDRRRRSGRSTGRRMVAVNVAGPP